MSDLISRQAAISAIYERWRGTKNFNGWEADISEECEEVLKAIPSAELEWVPCNEQMPEEHEWIGTKSFGTTISDNVFVTFENPKGERFTKYLSFQDGKLSPSDQQTINVFYKGSVPIAWMPRPEPWEGENI